MQNNKLLIAVGVVAVVILGALAFAIQESPRSAQTTPATEQQGQATLIAGTSTYTAEVQQGETVLEVMETLASTTSFTFSGKTYPSLGLFVESINGTPSAGDKYWSLYLNGTSSPVGVSQAQVSPGDKIEWKLEASQGL